MAQYLREIVFEDGLDKASYLNDLAVIKHLRRSPTLRLSSAVTFFVGENGTGKSTLLEAIAVAFGFNPEGGSRNFNFSTNKTHSELCDHIRLGASGYPDDGFFLRAESLYNAASYIDYIDSLPSFDGPVIGAYGGVSLHHQSHGESFLSIVEKRFRGKGLYILDEPEAALSPMRLMRLITAMDRLVKKGSQFIIATHSPILMAFPNSEILEFSEKGISSVSFKDTEHFKVTKQFIENPERMLHYLLKD